MKLTMQAIETTGTIDTDGQLLLDQPLQETRSRQVRVIVLLPDETDQKDNNPDRNEALSQKTAVANVSAEPSPKPPVWERVDKISAQISEREWAELPKDLSKNLDHYLYGSPKAEE